MARRALLGQVPDPLVDVDVEEHAPQEHHLLRMQTLITLRDCTIPSFGRLSADQSSPAVCLLLAVGSCMYEANAMKSEVYVTYLAGTPQLQSVRQLHDAC